MQNFRRFHGTPSSSPLIMFLLGALVLLLWAAGTVVQIQTSELLAQGGSGQASGIAWSIWTQPYLIVTGQVPPGQSAPWMYGWIVEVTTLVVALAFTVALNKLREFSGCLLWFFAIASLLLLILNSYADYNGTPGSGLVRFLVALALGMVVTVGLPLGAGLILHGIEEF